MKLIAATKKLAGLHCKICDREIHMTEYVLHHRQPNVFTSAADVVVHAFCVKAKIDTVRPEDLPRKPTRQTSETSLARERKRILATGKVFA